MGTCEPGQGRKSAAISSHLFVRWVSHPAPPAAGAGFVANVAVCDRGATRRDSPFESGLPAIDGAPPWLHPTPISTTRPCRLPRKHPPRNTWSWPAAIGRRPSSELIGQEHVARALTRAIATNRVGHAYLFTGARGVGKTSAARILAKALNCVHGPDPHPLQRVRYLSEHQRGQRRRRARDRRRQQPRHRRDSPVAPERQHPPQPCTLQDLHHRRSSHAHARGLQRVAQDARRAARAREVHLLHDRADEDSRSRSSRAASGSISPASVSNRSWRGCSRSSRPKGSRPSPRRWRCWPAAPPARCATASRCWSSCLAFGGAKITTADVHGMLGTASEARMTALVGSAGDARYGRGD